MKKILWIALILILLFVLFLWFGPKHDEQAHSDHKPQSTAVVASTESNSSTVPTTTQTALENVSNEAPVQLGAYAALNNSWVTAPPPGSSVAAMYTTISNSGRAAVKVVSVESDDFEEMMFHRTVIENGVASMKHVDYLEVPSAGSLVLEPNGLHIMAMEPERELKAGDQVSINFTFDNGETYSATVPVR